MSVDTLRTDFEVRPEEYEAELDSLIEMSRLDEDLHFAARLSQEYSSELPYHHYGHTLGTARRALEIAQERGLDRYSIQVVFLAALWHDAEYGAPLDETLHESREHRSARYAYEAIITTCSEEKLESTPLFARHVSAVILGTNTDHESTDELCEILNMADLANLYHEDLLIMLRETGAYFIEGLLLGGVATRAQMLEDIKDHKDKLEGWIGGAKGYVERLVRQKLDPDDPRTITALEHIKEMTVGQVLEALTGNSSD